MSEAPPTPPPGPGERCELARCNRKYPHFGINEVPGGPTHWFCNSGHYKEWKRGEVEKEIAKASTGRLP